VLLSAKIRRIAVRRKFLLGVLGVYSATVLLYLVKLSLTFPRFNGHLVKQELYLFLQNEVSSCPNQVHHQNPSPNGSSRKSLNAKPFASPSSAATLARLPAT